MQDVFNDKIDFKCSCFEDAIRLNREMPTIAQKYAFFDCTNSALGVIQNFLENMEILQTFLGEIESTLIDAKSSLDELEDGKEKLKQQAIEYNALLEKIENKERENEETRKKEIVRNTEYKRIFEYEAQLKKLYPHLSYEEAIKLSSLSPTFSIYEPTLLEWTSAKSFELLYRGSRDGFSAASFHSQCNNKGPTLVLIKSTEGFLFGGYAPISWTSRGDYAPDNKTFIFTLLNPHNIEPTKFANSDFYSIYDHSSQGPIFGRGHDIHVFDNCNSCCCSCYFPHSFSDTTGIGQNIFVNSSQFLVAEIEIYSVVV